MDQGIGLAHRMETRVLTALRDQIKRSLSVLRGATDCTNAQIDLMAAAELVCLERDDERPAMVWITPRGLEYLDRLDRQALGYSRKSGGVSPAGQ